MSDFDFCLNVQPDIQMLNKLLARLLLFRFNSLISSAEQSIFCRPQASIFHLHLLYYPCNLEVSLTCFTRLHSAPDVYDIRID